MVLFLFPDSHTFPENYFSHMKSSEVDDSTDLVLWQLFDTILSLVFNDFNFVV